MFSYLLNRRGNYHVRIRVPADLSGIIPSAELVKSLKTRDQKQAQVVAQHYLQAIVKTFSLFRSGYISAEQVKERVNHVLGRTPKLIGSDVQREDVPASTRLSSVISRFVSDKEREWSPKTKMENEASLRLLLDIVGDVTVERIERETARRYRDALCILPANVYKVFPEMTPLQVMAGIQPGGSEIPPMSTTTVNKHLSRFSTLVAFCVREGILRSNPVGGMTLKQKRKPDEERKAYSVDDLRRIIDNLPHREEEPERYWIPMIGMYSGLRLDEICQLYTDDVKEIDGLPCFDVNDAMDKKLKTVSSKRIVPVHPHLIDLGFLAYVQKVRESARPRLWMNLQRRDADGYGSAYGKVFQRFNRNYITPDRLKTFHSLRHTFADALKQQGEQEALISELLGHANGSITTGRYGKRYQPRMLFEAVRKLNWRF